MQRGERQQERTQAALISAFLQLVKEQSYSTITIQEICERANVGRSTFYRHFASKADILLQFHTAIFAQLTTVYATADQWLALEPPPQLVSFLQRMQPTAVPTITLYQFGNDIDYIFGQMDKLLTAAFTQSLVHAFADKTSTMPLAVVAQSIAGMYSTVIRSWFTGQAVQPAAVVATHLQRLARATIQEALGKAEGS